MNLDSMKKVIRLPPLLSAVFLTTVVTTVYSGVSPIDYFEYTRNFWGLNLILTVCLYIFLLSVSYALKRTSTEYWFMLGSSLLFFLTISQTVRSEIFALASGAVFFALTYYSFRYGYVRLPALSRKGLIITAVLSMLFFMSFVGVLMALRTLSHRTPGFDFGLFAQMFEYMRTTGLPLTTYERGTLLSHFAVHVSPIYYLLLPFYALVPHPATLQVLQAVVVGSGIIPLCLLSKKLGNSNTATAVFSLVYAFSSGIMAGCFFDLHENMFLTPLILWLFYFIERDTDYSGIGILVFSILVMLVKEDAAVYVACIALYLIFSGRKLRLGFVLFALSVVYFAFCIQFLNQFGDGAMTNRYQEYMFRENGSLVDVIIAVITNPGIVLHKMFTQEKLMYVLLLTAPLCFLPFLNRKPAQWLLFIPLILINLMTRYPYQHKLFFQYSFGVCGILMYLTLKNFSEFQRKQKDILSIASLGITLILFCNLLTPKLRYIDEYYEYKEQNEIITETLSKLPHDGEYSVSTFLVAAMYDKKFVYELTPESRTEYIVIDLRYGDQQDVLEDFEEYGYIYEEKIDDAVVIMKKA